MLHFDNFLINLLRLRPECSKPQIYEYPVQQPAKDSNNEVMMLVNIG